MTINQITAQTDTLTKVQLSQIKGGTQTDLTINTIIIDDIDGF